jgi:hypothetical protein
MSLRADARAPLGGCSPVDEEDENDGDGSEKVAAMGVVAMIWW